MTEEKDNEKVKKLNLYQKLLEIRKCVEYIQKNSTGFKFKYADETAILAIIRPEMDNQGVFLRTSMDKPEEKTDGKIVEIGFSFTWINTDNPSEEFTDKIYLQSTTGDPQKIGGLLTYATRYHLYKLFNVATDDMDIDAYHNMTGKISAEQVADLEQMLNGDMELRARMLKWAQADNLSQIHFSKLNTIISAIKKHKEEKKEEKEDA